MSNQVVSSPMSQLFDAAVARTASPDAELIALARDLLQRVTRLHRCDAGLLSLDDEEYELEQDRIHEGGRVLMQFHPVTMEGLVAKAQMVRVQFERLVACDYGRPAGSSGETHERLAWSVLNDLLEMTGSLEGVPTFARGIGAH